MSNTSESAPQLAPPLPSREERLQSIIRARDLDALGGLLEAQPTAIAYRVPPPGYTPLHIATSVAWEEGVLLLLEAGADINAVSLELGLTPLRIALGYGLPQLATLLLERGADPSIADGNGKTTLQVAAYSGNRDMVKMLLGRGIPVDIFAAVALGDDALVRRLHGADAAVLQQRMISHQNVTITPLQLAAFLNQSAMVQLLLELGAAIDARDEQGRSATDLALHSGKREAYECLRAHGASVDPALLEMVGSAERAVRIARLHQALVDGALERAVVELDADPTLLHQRFPDVWGTGGTFGATPLHWAAMFGHLHLVQMLLDRGADLTLRDLTYNATPSGWANEYQRREMVAFLEARGSKT